MKIDRLLSIITILLQQNKVTAPELAKKLEVSRRTINRDIEDICKAGIPIITYQGGNGGISVAEGYKLDKSILSVDELQSIITGLKSLESISDTIKIQSIITKLSPKNQSVIPHKDNIRIDLSSHYKSSLYEKINLLKIAIERNTLVKFDYYSDKGFSTRTIEPYYITFKWTAWYIFAYCIEKNDFRLFKLNRLWRQKALDQKFIPREIPAEKINLGDYFTDENYIKINFDRCVEYRLVEEYGPDCYEVMEDGSLDFTIGYTNKENIISWVLGFGDKAIVTEPMELAKEVQNIVKNITSKYKHDT